MLLLEGIVEIFLKYVLQKINLTVVCKLCKSLEVSCVSDIESFPDGLCNSYL